MGADGNLTRLVVAGVLVNLIQVTWPSRYSGDLAKTGLVIARFCSTHALLAIDRPRRSVK